MIHAYVDPGLIGNLGQVLYAAVLAGVGLFIIRPWRFLRSRVGRREPTPAPESESEERQAHHRH